LPLRVDAEQLSELVDQADVVLDCSDNFATRYAVNRACAGLRKPLVSGAAILTHGQLAVFDFRRADSPCYNCLFAEESEAPELRCATTGVFAPLVGIIGTMQAAEAIKLLVGVERGLCGKLLFVDALDMNFMRSDLCQDPSCSVCGAAARQTPGQRN
jgi:molybdopterin/thiamine biosynthesis adenylyltransferase